jgi:hypothetical protein
MSTIWGESILGIMNPLAWVPDMNAYTKGWEEYKRSIGIPEYDKEPETDEGLSDDV